MATTEELVQTIEKNVPEVYEAGQTSVLSKCANALIGEKVGNSIAFDDLSPFQDKIIKVSVESKNLVPLVYHQNFNGKNPVTIRGIVFTTNDDGSITMNGKFDETGDISFFLVSSTTKPFVLQKGTYIGSTGQSFATLGFMKLGGGYGSFGTPITFFEETKFQYLYIGIQKSNITGKTFNGETIYPMLMRGTVCEEYIEPVASGTSVTLSRDGQEISTAVGETVEFGEGADYSVIEQGSSIVTDTEGVSLHTEYKRDINVAFAELQQAIKQAIISLGGNV